MSGTTTSRTSLLGSTVVLLGILGSTSGCAGFNGVLRPGGGGETTGAGTYEGEACRRVYYDLDDHDPESDYNHNEKKFPIGEDTSPEAQLLLATCARHMKKGRLGHETRQWNRIKPLDPEKVYLSLDDRDLDIVSAALSAVIIGNDEVAARFQHERHYKDARYQGLVLFYASLIRREDLSAALARIAVPAEVKTTFLAQFDGAAQRARAAGLAPEEMTVYVKIPLDVHASRSKHYEAYTELYAELDELLAKSEKARGNAEAAAALAPSFVDLRSRFVAKCGTLDCRGRPLWAHTTRELALLAVAEGKRLDAHVESHMHEREGSYVGGFIQAITAAQYAELSRMREASAKYQKAKENGIDEQTARTLAGGTTGFRFKDRAFFHVDLRLPTYAKALDGSGLGSPRASAFPVGSVQPAAGGKGVKITFEKDRHPSQEAYNCRTTNRISRIHRDGRLDYEEVCNWRPVTVESERHKPVTVPAAEAKNLQRGDVVSFLALGEEARIVEVKRGDVVVQLRGDAVREPN
ncbi:hypothetical protein [Polyangium mundeleinium]|uniref:Lipoprotein n=1 Tax=Polyangium mundeleinium TaxID=2995306 RepID=A0ABT5F6A4_9BACT|nr:hypothetical protein [Polyangium mundeleinium]MDC0749139.1 hypothetical protein [Polyangium mundeleinium]